MSTDGARIAPSRRRSRYGNAGATYRGSDARAIYRAVLLVLQPRRGVCRAFAGSGSI